MQIDVKIIPVRLAAAATRRIRADAAAWEQADDHPPFGRLRPGEQPCAISLALTADASGIDTYAPFPHRTQRQAEYLLDPDLSRQLDSYELRERTMPYRIIFGDELFAEHAQTWVGFQWRCSPAAFLRQAAATIDSLDPVAARDRFSTEDMGAQRSFKTSPREEDEYYNELLQGLRDLATYYHMVADRGLDIIVYEF